MRTQITIIQAGGPLTESYPIHPDAQLREATAKALNTRGGMPREGIWYGIERRDNGSGGYPVMLAWIYVNTAKFMLCERVFAQPISLWEPSGWQPWAALTVKSESEVAA